MSIDSLLGGATSSLLFNPVLLRAALLCPSRSAFHRALILHLLLLYACSASFQPKLFSPVSSPSFSNRLFSRSSPSLPPKRREAHLHLFPALTRPLPSPPPHPQPTDPFPLRACHINRTARPLMCHVRITTLTTSPSTIVYLSSHPPWTSQAYCHSSRTPRCIPRPQTLALRCQPPTPTKPRPPRPSLPPRPIQLLDRTTATLNPRCRVGRQGPHPSPRRKEVPSSRARECLDMGTWRGEVHRGGVVV